ncbi:MAG: glutathione peroxidase [Saprospiraceae bacterium]|nr:glutathione peroxidase [Saprospiraceae bacterium]
MSQDLTSIYEYSFKKLNSSESISLSAYKGKKLLLVNVASECGNTKQYTQLQELHALHGDKVAILGFPSNDFGKQEPGTESDIATFCEKNYGVEFPMFEKISVIGPDTHPLYKFMSERVGELVEWNFGKYIVDVDQDRVNYFLASTDPLDEALLSCLGITI